MCLSLVNEVCDILRIACNFFFFFHLPSNARRVAKVRGKEA